MIRPIEIKQKARGYGVPVSTIERDYVQSWLLKTLGQIDMVLKGGTGLKKVYVENYRFSDDLDFTLLQTISTRSLKSQIRKAVIIAREESGINFRNEIKFNDTKSGLRANIHFTIIKIAAGTETSIKLDITYSDREHVLLPIIDKRIFHSYSDRCNATVNAYALEEIVAEKLRALFERKWPRDLYDIWYFRDYLSKKIVIKTFREKCKFKNIPVDISSLEEHKNNLKNAWKSSLSHQFNVLPAFEKVYNEVLESLRQNIHQG